MSISKLAVVDPKARIGNNVVIEPFAVIEGDVEIGDGTKVGPHAVIRNGARIGKNVRIFSGASISEDPQDLKFEGEYSTTHIGDNTHVREFCTLHRGTKASGKTVLGSDCLLMAYSHIAHDCVVGNNCIIANSCQMGGHVTVEDYVVIGGVCALHQFSRVGKHAMIAASVIVRQDVPPFVMAGRVPLAYMGVNSRGLRRRGFSPETIQQIQEIYRYIYLSDMNNTQALLAVENELEATAERDAIIDFFRTPNRSIIPAVRYRG